MGSTVDNHVSLAPGLRVTGLATFELTAGDNRAVVRATGITFMEGVAVASSSPVRGPTCRTDRAILRRHTVHG